MLFIFREKQSFKPYLPILNIIEEQNKRRDKEMAKLKKKIKNLEKFIGTKEFNE